MSAEHAVEIMLRHLERAIADVRRELGKGEWVDRKTLEPESSGRRMPRSNKATSGFVYFIRAGEDGPIKIGFSRDVPKRLRELQTAHADELRVLLSGQGDEELEASLHTEFSHLRIAGEWFKPGEDLVRFILECGGSFDHPVDRLAAFLSKPRAG